MATSFSSRRLENIKRNQELLEELGAVAQAKAIRQSTLQNTRDGQRKLTKRPRNTISGINSQPTRASARIAAAAIAPAYDDVSSSRSDDFESTPRKRQKITKRRPKTVAKPATEVTSRASGYSEAELDELQASWSSWTPVAGPPTRDAAGVFHFDSHPDFIPNKSPAEIVREGAFGGSYFRPLYSKRLGITISDDYLELPESWYQGLDCSYYLTSSTYDPEANKFKVACGQSIEEWEASGWINHQFDVRGWFQWYCRFFQGRRCEDDERQISRWKKCVGSTGRWRRMLLKKYVALGVRTVWDDGEDEDAPEVSPVMHQTCHHWAFEVTQDVLDYYWKTGT